MRDEQPDIDPLFIGLTRPPLVLGVPIMWFGLNFMFFGVGLIAFTGLIGKFLWLVLVSVPLHLFGYWMTTKDAHWMSVFTAWTRHAGPTRNKSFWKSNSFSP